MSSNSRPVRRERPKFKSKQKTNFDCPEFIASGSSMPCYAVHTTYYCTAVGPIDSLGLGNGKNKQ